MTIAKEIDLYLRARVPLIVIASVEEARVLKILGEVATQRDKNADVISWDVADQFQSMRGSTVQEAAKPVDALDKISVLVEQNPKSRDIFVLKDFHEFWAKDPQVRRKLKNLATKLRYTTASLVAISPATDLPAELRNDAIVVEFPLPNAQELRAQLDVLISSTQVQNELTVGGHERLAQAALGLTSTQADRAFAKAIVRDKVLDDRDIGAVLDEKKEVIRASEALEFYAADESPDDVGGLEILKKWLALRERAFSEEAAAYGLPAPKGMALVGIPGTGKSLTAKMIGGLWNLPLMRLDVGALFGSLVGESEERVRRALRLAETVAPCVLWIDELEKSLSSGGQDGRTSQRVFGTILTWMQEKTKPVFVVATANDISALPPEVLRRGRFEEIFILDLPTDAERAAILRVHLRKRRRDPSLFDIERHARVSQGYVGAELEQAVIDALYTAFDEGRDITNDDIEHAITKMVPLSRSQRERIEMLRAWLREGRAQSASFTEAAAAFEAQVPLELSS